MAKKKKRKMFSSSTLIHGDITTDMETKHVGFMFFLSSSNHYHDWKIFSSFFLWKMRNSTTTNVWFPDVFIYFFPYFLPLMMIMMMVMSFFHYDNNVMNCHNVLIVKIDLKNICFFLYLIITGGLFVYHYRISETSSWHTWWWWWYQENHC